MLNKNKMTIQEALVINVHGFDLRDDISGMMFKKAREIIKNEYDRIYLETKKEQLERELNELNQKIQQHKLPF
jgi:methyl coenzyme M reductase gamma subunit